MAAVNPLTLNPRLVAFAGDWHANLAWSSQAVYAAAELGAEVIVHVGDFGYDFRPTFLQRLTQTLALAGVPLMFVDGNHEDHRMLARMPTNTAGLRPVTDWIWHIPRGTRWRWRGLRFLGMGGAHSVDGTWRRVHGQLWQPEERVTPWQVDAAIKMGPVDVLVAHDCPAGVPIPGLTRGRWPEVEIAAANTHRQLMADLTARTQPRMIVHGHYHVRYRASVDLGYGPVQINGLDCDGTSIGENLALTDLIKLRRTLTKAATGRQPNP